MENMFADYSNEILFVIFLNLFLTVILFILNITKSLKIKKLTSKYNKFMNGLSSDKNFEGILEEYSLKVNEVSFKNREIENQINHIERNMMNCIQKVGAVRYNAFENVGSDLSFAIALLDNNDSGIVLSGIYSRDSSSTYAKPILSGKSKYPLSAEEVQALEIAKKQYREFTSTEK